MVDRPAVDRTMVDRTTVDHWVVIHAGSVIPVPGGGLPLTKTTILVKNDRIDAILPGFDPPYQLKEVPKDQVETIDLSDAWVLPGLIDAHVHLTDETSPTSKLDAVTKTPSDELVDGVVFARRTLLAGFTTVRDLSSDTEVITALRDGIRDHKIRGPRIVAAGEGLSPTGGHNDPRNGYRDDVFPVEPANICDGADQCRKAVRLLVQRNVDVIKFMATGGVLDDSRAGTEQQFTDEEMKAIVDTAHALGRKVAAHAHGINGIKAAIRAGVDSIEHGTFLDDEAAKAMKDHGIYLVPTLIAGATVAERAEIEGYFPPAIRDKARAIGKLMGPQLTLADKAGVPIAFGTDSGVSEHGRNGEEFALMVKAGMTPAAAIRAATVGAADLLGLNTEIGTIEVGKAADLIAVAKDPLTEVTAMQTIEFVMKAGEIVKSEVVRNEAVKGEKKPAAN